MTELPGTKNTQCSGSVEPRNEYLLAVLFATAHYCFHLYCPSSLSFLLAQDTNFKWRFSFLTFSVPTRSSSWFSKFIALLLLPMSIDILDILKRKKLFHAHFWSKKDYLSSIWCKVVQISEWMFGLKWFVQYLRSYLLKTWNNKKFGV